MNRNVFEALNATPDGGAPKNPFDLHSYEWMTSKAGQLLPVGCREVVPDGTYDLSVDAYTMTFPCNTASQADMKENYYFMFVPYYLLTRTAYSFFPQRKDNHSALDYQYSQMPWFPLGDVVHRLVIDCYLYKMGAVSAHNSKDVHGYFVSVGALRLLDLLGYGCYLDLVQKCIDISNSGAASGSVTTFMNSVKENLNQYKPNVLRIAAYQKAWYCYFRNSVYDNNISPKAFNFDDVTYPSDTTYNILDYRSVDDFIDECLQIRYVQNKKDVVNSSMPGTQFGAVSSVPLTLDLTDLGGTFTGTPVTPTFYGNNVSLAGVLNVTSTDKANHFYSKGNTGVPLTDQEWDAFQSDGAGGSFKMEENMIFSGTVPQDGSQMVRPYKTVGISSELTNVQGEYGYKDVGGDPVYNLHRHSLQGSIIPSGTISQITPSGTISFSGGSVQTSLFDVLQLTEAQAIQKWRQKSMLAGQKSKDQWRAHYGVVPEHMRDDYPDFIGSVDNMIQISQVVSQANTMADEDRSNLGDIAGRGYGASSNKKFRFHAKEYGVIILLRSIVAENVYSSYGIDRANQLIYYSDFWQPEFQNIGLEAVPKTIIQGFKPSGTTDPTGEGGDSPLPVTSTVIGYAPRNYQLKQYLSKAHGLFNPSRFTQIPFFNQNVPFGFGELESFVQLRRDVIQRLTLGGSNLLEINPYNVAISLSTLYVNPAITNSTFAFDADDFEDTDTFIHKHRFNCDSVQPLSTLGLPQF